jgi:uncharacterized cupredoxin-like copper-binding protein
MTFRRTFAAATLLALTALTAACTPAASGATPIQVTLHDDRIEFDESLVPAGRLALDIRNEGVLVHEVEVFSGASEGQVLTVSRAVADTTGLELVDEVENILGGSAALLVVDLSSGTYLIICNLPGHYQSGMSTYITVEESTG